MYACAPPSSYIPLKLSPGIRTSKNFSSFRLTMRDFKVFAVASMNEAANFIPAAPIILPQGPWKEIPGGVTAANGFKAAGIYGGLRAKGEKPDLALVTCDVDAIAAGAFTQNMVAAAPVLYCKNVLNLSQTARAVLINAGQANAATGNAGYQDVIECADAIAKLLKIKPHEVLIESTGVIGQRIKKVNIQCPALLVLFKQILINSWNMQEALLSSLPKLVSSLSTSTEVGDANIRIGGIAKGSGMIHPNMATMLGVITTDALVESEVWRKMVKIAVNRSFNQITVDGDTSTNDTVIALASGLSGKTPISSLHSHEAEQLQAGLDAVMQGLAKSIAWDGEGATCLIEVTVVGAESEMDAAKVARSVASSSLVKAAVYGRDPNWGRIAAAAGYSGIPFDQNKLRILLGDTLLMNNGQPLPFDRSTITTTTTSLLSRFSLVSQILYQGNGTGGGQAWGCDLSYDYVKINAEYTT
ncbi:unnamed protein product [Linum tenue]|uniref:Arginine biosynthesis bifunctional protein ArgJ, chloroplastic n=1 Tax=Linum tenue TaxID=586396 RepID=A0AAV0PPF4_9ROSI|nr:unnamed protein product [Linum tenue]